MATPTLDAIVVAGVKAGLMDAWGKLPYISPMAMSRAKITLDTVQAALRDLRSVEYRLNKGIRQAKAKARKS